MQKIESKWGSPTAYLNLNYYTIIPIQTQIHSIPFRKAKAL